MVKQLTLGLYINKLWVMYMCFDIDIRLPSQQMGASLFPSKVQNAHLQPAERCGHHCIILASFGYLQQVDGRRMESDNM